MRAAPMAAARRPSIPPKIEPEAVYQCIRPCVHCLSPTCGNFLLLNDTNNRNERFNPWGGLRSFDADDAQEHALGRIGNS
jgi:hypothetical protein